MGLLFEGIVFLVHRTVHRKAKELLSLINRPRRASGTYEPQDLHGYWIDSPLQ